MGKVSIGLRGWRFDEEDVFTDDGGWRPLDEIPADPRHRLVRLQVVIGKPCDACYLIHGEAGKRRCREAEIVYGEPLEEVVLCGEHEADFLYWYREAGGAELAGEEAFRDAFHEWFADGGRAPEGYGGLEHVESAPEALPEFPDPEEVFGLEAELLEDQRAELESASGAESESDAETDAEDGKSDIDVSDLDLDREYPT